VESRAIEINFKFKEIEVKCEFRKLLSRESMLENLLFSEFGCLSLGVEEGDI